MMGRDFSKLRKPAEVRRRVYREIRKKGFTVGLAARVRDWSSGHVKLFLTSHYPDESFERIAAFMKRNGG